MNTIPDENTQLLNAIKKSKVVGFTFCGMKDCNESIVHKNGKYSEATWGVIFQIEDKNDVGFTWGENSKIGDPFYIKPVSAEYLKKIDSLETQVASNVFPWNEYIGKSVTNITVHHYHSNYNNTESWYSVPWGIEFDFNNSIKMLVGALHHGDFTRYLLCADEIVIIFDSSLIKELIQSHSNYKSEWENTPKNTQP